MNKIIAYFQNLFTPSTATLVKGVGFAEDIISRSIIKQTDRLSEMDAARAALMAAIRKADADLDTAYKLLHRVSGLTK